MIDGVLQIKMGYIQILSLIAINQMLNYLIHRMVKNNG